MSYNWLFWPKLPNYSSPLGQIVIVKSSRERFSRLRSDPKVIKKKSDHTRAPAELWLSSGWALAELWLSSGWALVEFWLGSGWALAGLWLGWGSEPQPDSGQLTDSWTDSLFLGVLRTQSPHCVRPKTDPKTDTKTTPETGQTDTMRTDYGLIADRLVLVTMFWHFSPLVSTRSVRVYWFAFGVFGKICRQIVIAKSTPCGVLRLLSDARVIYKVKLSDFQKRGGVLFSPNTYCVFWHQ